MAEFIRKNYISVIFATTLISATVNIYSASSVNLAVSAAAFAYTVVVFLLYWICEKKQSKWLTCGVAVGMMFLSVLAWYTLLTGIEGYNPVSAGMWIFQPRDTDVYSYVSFPFALMFVFGFFISTVVFYFTNIRYRRLMLFLAALCPFALYAKTFTDIPVGYSVLTVICYFLIMFKHNAEADGRARGKAVKIINDGGYVITAFAFSLAVITIASFCPKPDEAPFREQFDSLITGVQLRGAAAAYGNFTDTSSNASSGSNSKELLYTVVSPSPVYLRRQVFDVYNGTAWVYLNNDRYNTGYGKWRDKVDAYNLELVSRYLYELSDDDERLREYAESVSSRRSSASVRKEYNGSVKIVLSVCNLLNALGFSSRSDTVYRTTKDEYFTEYSRLSDGWLILSYMNNAVSGDFSDYITAELIDGLLPVAEPTDEEELAGYKALRSFRGLLGEAEDYRSDSALSVYEGHERVEALAAEITEGCETDYERAVALESYFMRNGFVYDLDYVTDKPGVVSFLFESKTGTCSDFATAMTLMARAVGISSRYVEGFVMSEKDEDGNYLVRVGDSHAFPELYINGVGWVDFEPTVAASEGSLDETYILAALGTAAFAALAICVVAVLLYPTLLRFRFRRRYARADGEHKIIIVFEAVERLLCERLGAAAGTLSAADISTTLTERYSIDGSALCEGYNRAVFGGERAAYGDAYSVYEQLRLAVKNEKKKKRQKRDAKTSPR